MAHLHYIPSTSTHISQAMTPSITTPSPQTPNSPKLKFLGAKLQGFERASTIGTPTPASTASIPIFSTPMDRKGGASHLFYTACSYQGQG